VGTFSAELYTFWHNQVYSDFSDHEVFPGCDYCIKDLLLLLLLHRDCCHIIIIHSIPTTFLAHVARYQCLCRLAARDFICLCWYSSFSLMGILELICPPSFKTGIVESNKNPDHLSTTTCTRLWKSVFWATSYQHDSIKAIKDAICFMQWDLPFSKANAKDEMARHRSPVHFRGSFSRNCKEWTVYHDSIYLNFVV